MIPETITMKVIRKEAIERDKNRLKLLDLENINIYMLGRRKGTRKGKRKTNRKTSNEEMKISCIGNSFENLAINQSRQSDGRWSWNVESSIFFF